MEIRKVVGDRRRYLQLLLLADEQLDMVERYLDRGDMWVLVEADGADDAEGVGGAAEVLAECLVTDEGAGVLELKSLAVAPGHQGQGLGRALIEHVARTYAGRYHALLVGTGDSPLTVPFYERCGFTRSHVVPDFFTEHYDHPIYEAGVLLRDMVYLKRPLA